MSSDITLSRLDDLPGEARVATIGNRVFDALRQAIVEFDLPPGHLLSEADVARRMGVSRQPVREAFIKLSEVGLVEIRPQRGTLVLLISKKEVKNARFVREAVETALARRAAEEADSRAVALLKDNLARQAAAVVDDDQTLFLRLDENFHHLLAQSVDCEHAWWFLENIKVQLDRVRYLSLPETTPAGRLLEQHGRITDAIAARDPDEAAAAMRAHLGEVLTSLPAITAKHPDMFVD